LRPIYYYAVIIIDSFMYKCLKRQQAVGKLKTKANIHSYAIYLVVLFLAGLLAGCASDSKGEGDSIPVDIVFSGVGVSTPIDTNGDGINFIHVTGRLSDTVLGGLSLKETVEVMPTDPAVPFTTPSGGDGIEYELVQGHLVHQIEDSGEQIIMEFDSNTQCIADDPGTDPSFSFSGTLIVKGGTGRFVNADGTIDFDGEGKFLQSHMTGVVATATATHSGTIYLNP
jgi:hypothetical protein